MDKEIKQLYNLFYNGDTSAILDIVSRFRKELILFVNCYVHNLNDSEDIVSDTFVKIILKKPKLKDESSFKIYIFSIAKNLAIDYLRHKKIEKRFIDTYIEREGELNLSVDKIALEKAINTLKEEYRLIVYLRYFDGFKIEEICKIVNKNKKHVYNVLERAKENLKELLKGEEL